MKSNASEPLMTCRNCPQMTSKPGLIMVPGISMTGACIPGHAVSGMETARARIGLGNGTLEPVASMRRETLKRKPRESLSTDARHRGGTIRSSVEGRVICPERRDRVIVSSGNGPTALAGGAYA